MNVNQLHTGKKIILSLKTERINTLSYLCISLISLNFRLPYVSIFGGVSAMTKDQILFVNGFSNKFSGWGGEDDDMFNRCQSNQSQAISFFYYFTLKQHFSLKRYYHLSVHVLTSVIGACLLPNSFHYVWHEKRFKLNWSLLFKVRFLMSYELQLRIKYIPNAL